MATMLIKREYLTLIREGRKHTTIRMGKRLVRPGTATFLSGKETLRVEVTATEFKTIAELTDEDAVADGFASRADLMVALRGFYPALAESDPVTVVHFRDKQIADEPR